MSNSENEPQGQTSGNAQSNSASTPELGSQSHGIPDNYVEHQPSPMQQYPQFGTQSNYATQPGQAQQAYGQPQYAQQANGQQGYGQSQYAQQPYGDYPYGYAATPTKPAKPSGFGKLFSLNFTERHVNTVAKSVMIVAFVLGGLWVFGPILEMFNILSVGYIGGFRGFLGWFLGFAIAVVKALLLIGATRILLEYFVNEAKDETE